MDENKVCTVEGCPEDAFTKQGLCRKHNLEAARKRRGSNPVNKRSASEKVVLARDNYDRKLDHFQYTKDERDLDIWEQDQTISPLHIPKDIETKYPGMRFRWVSDAKLRRVGVGYQGWQIFKDGKYQEGVRRGNDLRLAAMPEERARRYEERVRSLSNEQMEALSQQAERFRDSDVAAIKKMGAEVELTGRGISVDQSVRRPVRGLHPEEVKERVAKVREHRTKGRVYFT